MGEEHKAIVNLRSEIEELENKILDLESKVLQKEFMYVYRLEELCMLLKSAVLDFSLKLPPQLSFERYLSRITGKDNLLYIIDLLHECWLFFHPIHFFDRPTKNELDAEQLLNLAFDGTNINVIDRNDFNVLYTRYYREFNRLSARLKDSYGHYMDDLLCVCKEVCGKFDLHLNDDFTISRCLISDKNLSIAKIDKVFSAVASKGLMTNDTNTAAAFRALFKQVPTVVENQIVWLDCAKSKSPNYASLYVMFKTMGVKMDSSDKEIICSAFTTSKGVIRPEQLKPRNESEQLNELQAIVEKAIS